MPEPIYFNDALKNPAYLAYVNQLPISSSAKAFLDNQSILYVIELVQYTEAGLLRMSNYNRRMHKQIRKIFDQNGLEFGTKILDAPDDNVRFYKQIEEARANFNPSPEEVIAARAAEQSVLPSHEQAMRELVSHERVLQEWLKGTGITKREIKIIMGNPQSLKMLDDFMRQAEALVILGLNPTNILKKFRSDPETIKRKLAALKS